MKGVLFLLFCFYIAIILWEWYLLLWVFSVNY